VLHTVISYIYVFGSGLLADALFVYYIQDTTFPCNCISLSCFLNLEMLQMTTSMVMTHDKLLFNLFQINGL